MDFAKSSSIQDRLSNNAIISDSGNTGFKATDFVQVMNIDSEPYSWEFCTEETIDVAQGGLTASRSAKVEKFSLEPGQTTEMPGNIALVFIDGIVKHLIQKDGKAKMINVITEQDKWINRVFLGKKGVALPYATTNPETGTRSFKAEELVKDPVFDPQAENPFPELNVNTDVTLVQNEGKKRGRPAKATA